MLTQAVLPPLAQEAFSGLLGDSNELTQEMASRGISVVYAMSGPAARKQLLDELVGVLQGRRLRRRAGRVSSLPWPAQVTRSR